MIGSDVVAARLVGATGGDPAITLSVFELAPVPYALIAETL